MKFFASLCLIAFMAGLLLGDIIKAPQQPVQNQLRQIIVQPNGLQLCLLRMPQVLAAQQHGVFRIRLPEVAGRAAQGDLHLTDGTLAKWQVESEDDGLQLGFVALQPLRGAWRQIQAKPCLEVTISLQPAD